MPNNFFSDEFGDLEDYFITDYTLIDQYIGDTLWLWGRNSYGQLGVNTTTNRSTPVTTLLGGTNWKSIAGGDSHTVALTAGQAVDFS
jgi:alpha-tubulin suppressor-like RCC1 family protein